MDYFLAYCLFAVTTSLASLYELVYPVFMRRIADTGNVEHKWLFYIVIFIINIIAAPFIFLSCIVPEMSIRFQETLYNGLFIENQF